MTDGKPTAPQKSRKRAISLLKNADLDKSFSDDDRVSKKLRLAAPLGTDKPPGASDKKDKKEDHTYTAIIGLTLNQAETSNMPFGRPLLDDDEMVCCRHCKKPILKPNAQSHIKACLKVKAEIKKERKLKRDVLAGNIDPKKIKDSKDKDDDNEKPNETEKPSKPSTTKTPVVTANSQGETTAKAKGTTGTKKKADDDDKDTKNSKKRKATDDDKGKDKEGPKNKKTKKEKPVPKPKEKGPVDVERQCGVPLATGLLCARSLTCKSHSMGAKRAVQGRPAPYDTLLAAYQKKNQAKQQKAAINASNPAPDDLEANSQNVDSDEEMELVMAAVARSNPQPIVPTILLSTRQKYNHRRFSLMLGAALKPPNPPMSAVDARPFGSFSFMGTVS